MDKETELWYTHQFDIFGEQGWKDLIEQAREMYEAYNRVDSLTSEDNLKFTQGRLDILKWLITWEEAVNKAWKELGNE